MVPVTLRAANVFVRAVHRHHPPVRGCCFSVGVELDGKVVGVAITGRPVARGSDDGRTAEVTRVATDGSKNACSILYAASARAAQALGYRLIQTYVLIGESGTSLRAAGWLRDPVPVHGRQWTTAVSGQAFLPGVRQTTTQAQDKIRWYKPL